MKRKYIWKISLAFTLGFLLLLLLQWYYDYNYTPAVTNKLTNYTKVNNYIKSFQQNNKSEEPFFKIPTGVFIQSIDFITPETIHVSGYVWQEIPKSYLELGITPGIIFPESINPDNSEVTLAYEDDQKDYKLYGYYFENDLFQSFSYANYPLDKKNIWLRMWPKDFYKNVILTPDLRSYQKNIAIFGIDHKIVLRNFNLIETYFSYEILTYNTDFGLEKFEDHEKFPELYFNIVLKRHLSTLLFIYLIPISVIWGVIFGMLVIITSNEKQSKKFFFNVSSILSSSALLFITLAIIHTNLRSRFLGYQVIYIEYFYLISYLLVAFLILTAYIIQRGEKAPKFLTWEDSLLPKALFWPLLFLVLNLITFIHFWVY